MSITTATSASYTENPHKKSAPGGAPIKDQINITPPRSKRQELAEFLLGCIGDSTHPVKRPKNASVDRELRGLIAERNKSGDYIINDGAGYYRPRRGDGFDEHCFDIYTRKELSRAYDIIDKVNAMRNAYYGGNE